MASIYRRAYTVTTATGRRLVKRCKTYTIAFTDANGRRRRTRGYTDKAATLQKAARLELAVSNGQEGLDQFKQARARALDGHVADYIAYLSAAGRDPMYVYNAQRRLAILVEQCGWQALSDITAESFVGWRAQRQRTGAQRGHNGRSNGASATTLNQYLATLAAFCNWCVKPARRMAANPITAVDKLSGDPVRKRRALTEPELAALLAAAPEHRRLAWETLLTTGLRCQEAADLQWQDVRIDATVPYLALRSTATKSRRADTIPLRQDLAAKLRDTRQDAKPTDRVFAAFPTLADWQADLQAAGIAYVDGAGRQVDRHSARTTLATRLQRAGVPIRVAMELMRHTDVRLTTKTYTDLAIHDVAGAVERLPGLPAAAVAVANS